MKHFVNESSFTIQQVITIGNCHQLNCLGNTEIKTMAVLKWLLQIFSLDSTGKRINKKEKHFYVIKCVTSVVILGVIDAFSLFWKAKYVYSKLNLSVVVTDVTQMSYHYLQYIVDLYFIYKYGREISQEYSKNYVCFDKILNITYHEEIKSRLIKLTSIVLFSWLIVSAFDFAVWYISDGWMPTIFYALAYFFLLFKILTNLDLTVQVLNVEYRLRAIGDLLQECYKSSYCSPIVVPGNSNMANVLYKNCFCGEGCVRNKKLSLQVFNFCQIILLTRCYLLIREQTIFINKMFGIRILLNSLSLLIDMVRFLNIVVRISSHAMKISYLQDYGYLPAISTFLRFLICVFILNSLVYHCERAYAQTKRLIVTADLILVVKNCDVALRRSVEELRYLAISRPITFNMANFFHLNYPFLVSMISVVVTYTIILLQSV